jgi:predicted RNA-binding protein with PIN domain
LASVAAMSPIYLIDGYNLIHALGLLHKRPAAGELEHARHELLAFLQERGAGLAGALSVIFDARRHPRRAVAEETVGDIQVLYAVKREAGDLMEELIAGDTQPGRLQVVSDDHRIQQAARRRGAAALGCQEFLDRLESRPRSAPPPPNEAPAPLAEERAHWLEEFGDVEIPPELRDTFDDDGPAKSA